MPESDNRQIFEHDVRLYQRRLGKEQKINRSLLLVLFFHVQIQKDTAQKRQALNDVEALSEVEARHMDIIQLETDIRVCHIHIPHSSSSQQNSNHVLRITCDFPVRNWKTFSKTQPTSLKSR